MKTIYFAFPGNEGLTSDLIKRDKSESGKFELRDFPDGESYVRILDDVKDKNTVIVCTMNQPNEKIIQVYLFAKTLKSLGATEVKLIAPYLSYMRQDKVFHPGEGLSSHFMAEFLSSFIDEIVTVDPHLHRIQRLNAVFKIKTQVVHTAVLIANWIKHHVPNALIIGPDSESEQWVSVIAQKTGAACIILNKTRMGDTEVKMSLPNLDLFKQHTPVLVDDVVSTGRTMIEILHHLKKENMKPAVCVVIHPLFSGNSYNDLLEAGASNIVSCNTIRHKSNVMDISELF